MAKIKSFNELISKENLINAFFRFRVGKKSKEDVLEFTLNLVKAVAQLHENLKNKRYKHGTYKHFVVNDPKRRDIHKASVRDRVLHHALYDALYEYFDNKFIYDSYSCRIGKGIHKAILRMKSFVKKESLDFTKPIYILKCDIKKFFASIDHKILKDILSKNIKDKEILWILFEIIQSFEKEKGKGLPLGNLTSQLLVNIYMNEFDHFVKRILKEKYYIRYADDFVFISKNVKNLKNLIPKIKNFLENNLKLQIHPDKIFIKKLASGVDFLGFVHFYHYLILRKNTKKRMIKNIKNNPKKEAIFSYLGLLKHGNTHKIQKQYFGV